MGALTPFAARLGAAGAAPLRRCRITTLQLNIGKRCNLACHHCHVESGPKRTEAMDLRGVERVLELLARNAYVEVLDITGGAPELHPSFRFLVEEARRMDRRVIDRCNLTVLLLPEQLDTARFLASREVEIVASLPCYTTENVEAQRGRGVFDGSVEALRWLNRLGYGRPGSALVLDLVYNPVGAFLPPSQVELETRYRTELRSRYGIDFHRLLTITNMPIKRFAHQLHRDGHYEAYMSLLVNHFNADTVENLMCRSTLSIGWDGRIYDCDFNQNLDLAMPGPERSIWDVDDLDQLEDRPIRTGEHCFGCTAGAGSSCGGSLS